MKICCWSNFKRPKTCWMCNLAKLLYPSAQTFAPATAIATKLLLKVSGDPLKRKQKLNKPLLLSAIIHLSPKQIPCDFLLKVHKCPAPNDVGGNRRFKLYSENCRLHFCMFNCFNFIDTSFSELEPLKRVRPKLVNVNLELSSTFSFDKLTGWTLLLNWNLVLTRTSAMSLWWR